MKARIFGAMAGALLSAAALGQTYSLPPVTSVNLPPVQAGTPILLVLPVVPPGDGTLQWAGKSIQQDMAADLSEMTRAQVIGPASAKAASDEAGALDQAHQFNANYVVYAAAQVSNNQLRVTGQVIDAATGKPLGSIKATAPADNLFPLEDSLAAQAAHALPTSIAILAPAPQTQPTGGVEPQYVSQPLPTSSDNAQVAAQPQPAATPQSPVAQGSDSSPYYSYTEALPPTYYTYNTYYYPDYYPYAYWGYPYYWGPYWGVGIGFGYYGWGGGWYRHGWYGGGPYYGHGFYGHSGFGRGFGGRGGGFGGGHAGGGGHR